MESSEEKALQAIERYKKIILARTEGQPLSRKSLLLFTLLTRELGRVSSALLKKNKKALEENLNNLVLCALCLATLYGLKIRAFSDDEPTR